MGPNFQEMAMATGRDPYHFGALASSTPLDASCGVCSNTEHICVGHDERWKDWQRQKQGQGSSNVGFEKILPANPLVRLKTI